MVSPVHTLTVMNHGPFNNNILLLVLIVLSSREYTITIDLVSLGLSFSPFLVVKVGQKLFIHNNNMHMVQKIHIVHLVISLMSQCMVLMI